MTVFNNISHSVGRKVMSGIIDRVLNGLEKDREKEFLKIVDIAKTFYGDEFTDEDYENFKKNSITYVYDICFYFLFIVIP